MTPNLKEWSLSFLTSLLTNTWSSHTLLLPWFLLLSKEMCYTSSEGIDPHVHGKKYYRFYTFELTIHFLAEENFLNIHSDALLNLTSGILLMQKVQYFLLSNVFNDLIQGTNQVSTSLQLRFLFTEK